MELDFPALEFALLEEEGGNILLRAVSAAMMLASAGDRADEMVGVRGAALPILEGARAVAVAVRFSLLLL